MAIIIETVDMGMPSSASGEIVSACLAEGLGHVFRGTTGIAFDPEIFGLQRCSAFEKP
ncbi:hypothetical protein FHX05_005264 [Rhizobium sp. BK491]|nr:hypothetical protein [Rhizobium sp. BK491]